MSEDNAKQQRQTAELEEPDTLAQFSIEQVALRTSLTKRTLRYYEEMGLVQPTERTEGNYRLYSEDDVRHLLRIKELRDLLGFSLTDIRTLLESEDERVQIREAFRKETDSTTKIAQLERSDDLIRRQLHLIEQKTMALEQMRSSLLAKLDRHEQTRQRLRNEVS